MSEMCQKNSLLAAEACPDNVKTNFDLYFCGK